MNMNEKLQTKKVQVIKFSLELVAWKSYKNGIDGVGGGVKNLTGVKTSLTAFGQEFILPYELCYNPWK